MKKLRIGLNNFALVDNEDYPSLSKYKWFMSQGYAKREIVLSTNPRKRETVSMHRQLLNFPDFDIDHIDRNKLNNQRANLRKTNKSLNGINRDYQKNSKSKIKGVCFIPKLNLYRSYLTIKKKQVFNTYHKNLSEAILARKNAEEKYHATT